MSKRTTPRKIQAAARFTRLRAAGVPTILTRHAAWYLSGGIVGKDGDHDTTVPLAAIATKVDDAEHFLPDWREAVA